MSDVSSVDQRLLWQALEALKASGRDVKALRNRPGYYVVDGYVRKHTEIVRTFSPANNC